MDLKKNYEALFQHWLNEFEQLDITQLTKELFHKYKNGINFITNFKLKNEEKIEREIIRAYLENFEFLFDDFLKIREIKILNSALSLKEIVLSNLLEAEQLFYKNLISAIKGFKKVKAISNNHELNNNKDDESGEKVYEIAKLANEHRELDDQHNCILIRFLKKTPPLVGIDLKNYGPFEKEDIAYLPQKNAEILLFEKFAEKIDIS